MKNLSPKFLALTASSLVAVITFLTSSVVLFFYRDGYLFFTAFLISLIVFIASGLFFYFFSQKLIYDRILEISRIFKDFEGSTRDKNTLQDESDALENLKRNVEEWAEARRKEIEQLQKMELYRKEYVGNVSHELKTPVFNIQGYITTLIDGGLNDKSINLDYLQRAERGVERMISIIEDLEAISQLESGQMNIEVEVFDLVALTREVMEAQELTATNKGIILSFREKYSLPLNVVADRFRIRQALTNLIVNSIKYGKEYGETKIKFTDYAESLQIEITDNGIGIDSKHQPRIFERFYRVDKSRSREQGGTGLGLSIVKHIIEAHKQTITVTSVPGEGSVFSFTLKKASTQQLS